MTDSDRSIVGVRFTPSGRVYYFSPNNLDLNVGDTVEVETDIGPRKGVVIIAPSQVAHHDVRGPLDSVTRLVAANSTD